MQKISKKTILVGAGKGGVGKSTLTVNLAIAMAGLGLSVGILDADLYGPSVPIMMGLRNLSPRVREDGSVIPFTKFGVQIISMGFFLEEARSIVWRGPMLHSMLERLINQVHWPSLDYLFIDLPPGTGDIPLSLQQLLTVDGSIVITTPQEVAFVDVIKAVNAFDQLKIPTLGLIENMVGFPFGESQGALYASRLSVPFLGSLPIHDKICKAGDCGIPYAFTETHEKLFFAPLAHNLCHHYSEKKDS